MAITTIASHKWSSINWTGQWTHCSGPTSSTSAASSHSLGFFVALLQLSVWRTETGQIFRRNCVATPVSRAAQMHAHSASCMYLHCKWIIAHATATLSRWAGEGPLRRRRRRRRRRWLSYRYPRIGQSLN